MNPLLLTMTFLTIMALLTSSEALRNVNAGIKDAAYNSSLALAEQIEEKRALSLFEEVQEEQAARKPSLPKEEVQEVVNYSTKSAPLNYDHGRPPNNARLNLYLVMDDGAESPYYEQTAQLLRLLYSGQPFFDEIANLEYKILDVLIQYKEEAKQFFFPDELASLPFKDKEVQRGFFRMLKGSPPLLHYITLEQRCNGNQKKVNFMFAPAEILQAAIPDYDLFQKALSFRNELWERIDQQELNRKTLSKDEIKNRTFFKNELTNFLNSVDANLVKQFDLTLGKKGGVIFVQDPVSGIVRRERIMKKRL